MLSILIVLVIVLAIITIAQIVRILELASEINGEKDIIKKGDNKLNAILMIIFLVGELFFMIYQTLRYKKFLLPESASVEGVETDRMLYVTFIIIGAAFFITQVLLFWYAYKYRFNKNRKAAFYPDNLKLEFIWTLIPTLVLGGLIVYGLNVWNKITAPNDKNATVIELYAKQFDWTTRYSGSDNILGKANYRLIGGSNALGIDSTDKNAYDDIIVKELHLPVGKPILLKFRSQDVIHSAYLPHFRVQMNVVPGMMTQFLFTPSITTEKMREITKNDKFDYILLCNKICGVAHFNMKMKVIVETPEQYQEWLKSQKNFGGSSPSSTAGISEKEEPENMEVALK